MITIPPNWSDESEIRRVFSWLTRIGAAPAAPAVAGKKFLEHGIREHKLKCIEILQKACVDAQLPAPVEVRAVMHNRTASGKGFIYTRPMIQARRLIDGAYTKWKPILSVNDLYAQADRECRG